MQIWSFRMWGQPTGIKLMPTITKKELVDRIAEKMGMTQSTVKTIIQCFLDEIISELAKGNP